MGSTYRNCLCATLNSTSTTSPTIYAVNIGAHPLVYTHIPTSIMPAIHILHRTQDDNVCPPSRPFCRDTVFDSEDHPYIPSIGNQASKDSSGRDHSYAGLIIVLVLFAVSFVLWLTWAKWPRTTVKALWKKIRTGRKMEDKGIRSPQLPELTSKLDSEDHDHKSMAEEVRL